MAASETAQASAEPFVSNAASARTVETRASRHSLLVRVTHWIITVCFFLLLLTGINILISHPRFYWGETGNVLTKPLFQFHIPSSRALVPTGYGYVLPDQNGWSRALHFQTAWLLVLTGLLYLIWGFISGHFRKEFLPGKDEFSWRGIREVIAGHLRLRQRRHADAASYNILQRVSYLVVVFILFPLIIWTGLALSPAFNSAVPQAVNWLGGRQSARTLHFFVTVALVLFVTVHVLLVCLSGFRNRMKSMITGNSVSRKERA
ncbi:MAG TPA: cytochrome b/b6 domain-containing protein [Candidatus Acidoferrales bacterium]|nr:cytochrome b/b6 domain-containing protein [Candidatus Acidoferrales bacterium]